MASKLSAIGDLPVTANKGYAGIDYFLVGSKSDVVITVDEATKMATIALITGAGAPAALTDVFKKITPKKNTSSLVNTKTGTPATGAISNTLVATMVLHGEEIEVEKMVDILSEDHLVIISVDFNGINKIGGIARGMDLTAQEDTTGTGADDLRGSTITLTGSEPKGLRFIDDTVLASLMA